MLPNASLVSLENLVRFESSVQQYKVKQQLPIKVSFIKKNGWLEIEQDGYVFAARISKQIIHQIGARVFPDCSSSYSSLLAKWTEAYKNRCEVLKIRIGEALRRNELIIYHYRRFEENIIYGIVSPAFEPMDQFEFRRLFMEQAKQTGLLDLSSTFVNQHGELTERFDYKDNNGWVKLSYLLHHTKNNGYNGIKISWGRIVIICGNDLTRMVDGHSVRWSHNATHSFENFVRASLIEGVEKKLGTEERIEKAMNRKLHPEIVSHFFHRLHLAEASKERVQLKFKEEIQKSGNNEWSLSQALTWTGTHELSMMPRPKQLLIEAGSMIVDHSLREFLSMNVYTIGEEKAFGPLLPKRVVSSIT